jgi:serine/threonine-protein kinase
VFALAAITYECMTGTVPFTGNNGPSILLAILTKDPDPPSTKAVGAKYPIPPGMDDVLEVALAKSPNIRTKSVGELALTVGRAYGLDGDVQTWARTPQADLAKLVEEGRARLPPPAPKHAPVAPEADPFAAPSGTSPMAAPMPYPASAPRMQAAPAYGGSGHAGSAVAPHPAAYDDGPAGVPGLDDGRPQWLIAVVVGLAALVVGGGIAILLAR